MVRKNQAKVLIKYSALFLEMASSRTRCACDKVDLTMNEGQKGMGCIIKLQDFFYLLPSVVV